MMADNLLFRDSRSIQVLDEYYILLYFNDLEMNSLLARRGV